MGSDSKFVLHTSGGWGPLPRRLLESRGAQVGEDELGGFAILNGERAWCGAARALRAASPRSRLAMTAGPVLGVSGEERPSRSARRVVWGLLSRAPTGALLMRRVRLDALAPAAREGWAAEEIGGGWSSLGDVSEAPSTRAFTWRANRAPSVRGRGWLERGVAGAIGRALERARVVEVQGAEGAGKTAALEQWYASVLGEDREERVGWAELEGVVEVEQLARRWSEALDLGGRGQPAEEWEREQLELLAARYDGGVLVVDQHDALGEEARALLVRLIEGTPGVRWVLGASEPLGLDGERVVVGALSGDEALAMIEESGRVELSGDPDDLVRVIEALGEAHLTPGSLVAWLDGSPRGVEEALETGALGRSSSEAFSRRLAGASGRERAVWVAWSRFANECSPEDVYEVVRGSVDVDLEWVKVFFARAARTAWVVERAGEFVVSASALRAIDEEVEQEVLDALGDAYMVHVVESARGHLVDLDVGPDVPALLWLEERREDLERAAWRGLERDPELGIEFVEALYALHERDLTVLSYGELAARALEVARECRGHEPRVLQLAACSACRREHDREAWREEIEAVMSRCDEPGASPMFVFNAHMLYGDFLSKEAYGEEGDLEIQGVLGRGYEVAREHGLVAAQGMAAQYLAYHHLYASRFEEAGRWLEVAQGAAAQVEHAHLDMMIAYTGQNLNTRQDRWEEARAHAEVAWRTARLLGHRQFEIMMTASFGYAELVLGRLDEAFVAFRSAEEGASRWGFQMGRFNCTFLLGVVELASGRSERALALLREVVEGYERMEESWSLLNALPWYAVALDERRDHDLAGEVWARLDDVEHVNPSMDRTRDVLRAVSAVLRQEEQAESLEAHLVEGSGNDPCVHLIRRHLKGVHAVAAPEEQVEPDLVVSAEGGVFIKPGDPEPVDISHRRALRRILDALVAARLSAAFALDTGAIFEIGWPGEAALPESAHSRVYVAINTLRKLGLDGLLVRNGDGYVLDPSCHIVLGVPQDFAAAAG